MPGLISSPLHFWLPEFISTRLREGFKKFDRKMKGYLTNDAVVVGVETRSSSAVRIPRDPETGQHPDIKGLFPAGEGSGIPPQCIEKAATHLVELHQSDPYRCLF